MYVSKTFFVSLKFFSVPLAMHYESLLVSNCVEKKKVKRRYNAFLKGVITRKGIITRSEKALLRLLCIKRRNKAF